MWDQKDENFVKISPSAQYLVKHLPKKSNKAVYLKAWVSSCTSNICFNSMNNKFLDLMSLDLDSSLQNFVGLMIQTADASSP